jgi:uncharacterized membrane protein
MPNPYSLSPVKPPEPGRLVVIGFSDENSAFSLRDHLNVLEEEGILSIGDAVVATRNGPGKVRLHQSLPLVSAGAVVGSFSGMVLGMLLLNPLFGSVAGAAIGAAAAALSDAGIDDAFMKELAETLHPRSSALFVVVRNTKPERLLERLQPFAGHCRVLQSTMSPENETCLRALLERAIHLPVPNPTIP